MRLDKELRRLIVLLIGRRNFVRLIGASAGTLLGFFILMAAIQLYYDASYLMEEDKDDLFGPGMMVIHKPVTLLNAAGLGNSNFSEEEISEIEKEKFISRVEPFEPCKFKVSVRIQVENAQVPTFVSDFFFEAVPDDILDVNQKRWKWEEGDSEIPVVLPADFLQFYNFGFAPGQDLPQLSETALRLATLKIRIEGRGRIFYVDGKIAGLSEKINSIMVPQAFMDWANEQYGDLEDIEPSRLVLVSETSSDPKLVRYIEGMGYITNQSDLKSGKLNQLLRFSLVITAIVGFVIILLALYLFVLSFRLYIIQSNYEIKNLVNLGLHPKTLESFLFIRLLFIASVIYLINALNVLIFHNVLYTYLVERGVEVMGSISLGTWLWSLSIMLFMLLVNYLNIRVNIRKLF